MAASGFWSLLAVPRRFVVEGGVALAERWQNVVEHVAS